MPEMRSNDEKKFYSKYFLVYCWFITVIGGLMAGYDIGISGGVTIMDDFLVRFFPSVYEKNRKNENNYCKFDNQFIGLYTSSLYLAAIVSSFFTSKLFSECGRGCTIMVASIFHMLGGLTNAAAFNLPMLIIGRIVLGVAVGIGNEALPSFLSELAPVNYQGVMNILYQLLVAIGIFCANMVNYLVSDIHRWCWTIALSVVAFSAYIFCGSFFFPEPPTSYIKLNQLKTGRKLLENIRRTEDVDAEFHQLVIASQLADDKVRKPFKELMKPVNRPPLVIAICLQAFQQLTGINTIIIYSPVLFRTIGFSNDVSLLSSMLVGIVHVLSTLVSLQAEFKFSRRVLLLQSCFQMLITQSIIGGILYANLKDPISSLGQGEAIAVVLLLCLNVMSFSLSWAPLGWLIPSEIFPLETRSAGLVFTSCSNMLFTFIIAQAFLSMLCHMKASIFFFFAAWILIMSFFVLFLLPETKNIPIDEMGESVWKQHWFWCRYMVDDDDKNGHKDHLNISLNINIVCSCGKVLDKGESKEQLASLN